MAQMPTLHSHKADLGFTLIELLIVVVIVGVLASIAYPAYQDSIRKGRRADASASLSAVQQAQERWRANNPAYASTLDASATPPGLGIPALTAGGYYGVAIGDVSGAGYSVTATAVAGKSQASDGDCVQLRVRIQSGNIIYGAAPAGGTTFDESSGNRCWVK